MEHRQNEKYEQVKDWKERNKESKEREREGNSIKENVPERIWKKSNLEKRRNVTYYFRFIFLWIWHEIKKNSERGFLSFDLEHVQLSKFRSLSNFQSFSNFRGFWVFNFFAKFTTASRVRQPFHIYATI